MYSNNNNKYQFEHPNTTTAYPLRQQKQSASILHHRQSFGLPSTERKTQNHQLDYASSYLDKLNTPLKYESNTFRSKEDNNNNNSISGGGGQYYNNTNAYHQNLSMSKTNDSISRQLLMKLDEAEQKLVISDKKYGELWRKYEISSESVKSLQRELTKSQQRRLQELLDLKNKFHLLQEQKHSDQHLLTSKQDTIRMLRVQIQDKTDKIYNLQRHCDELSVQLSQGVSHRELQIRKQQENRLRDMEYDQIMAVHKKQTSTLKTEIVRLQGVVQQKQSEKGKLLNDIDELYLKLKHSDSDHSQQIKSIQSEYSQWLEEAKSEKITLISTYQQKIKHLKSQLQQNQSQLQKHIENQTNRQKDEFIENQQHSLTLIQENRQLHSQVNQLNRDKKQLLSKVSKMENNVVQIKEQLNFMKGNKVAFNERVNKVEVQRNQQKKKYSEVLSELTHLKSQFNDLFKNNQKLATKQKQYKSNVMSLTHQVEKLKRQLSLTENAQLNLNGTISETNKRLHDKILHLQQQGQLVTRELLAQRLQNAKLTQQISEQSQQMRRQYQLSLQNIKKSLSKKIKQVKEEKSIQMAEKQEIYLQMRDLQRKYQLLMSQMVTVDDMMSIATKVHKRHSKFTKK